MECSSKILCILEDRINEPLNGSNEDNITKCVEQSHFCFFLFICFQMLVILRPEIVSSNSGFFCFTSLPLDDDNHPLPPKACNKQAATSISPFLAQRPWGTLTMWLVLGD